MNRRSFLGAATLAAAGSPASLITARGSGAVAEPPKEALHRLGWGGGIASVEASGARRLTKEKQFTWFEAGLQPAYVVKPGDVVLVECSHGLPGLVTREGRFSRPGPRDKVNPATGPIYVEGVRAGDALAIDILDIRTADWGYCSERVYEIREGHVVVNSRLRLAVQPMLGVVGIAPAKGGMDTRAPGDTGGNMDCREVRAGATLVFTAQAPGALAGFGDAHALQGDGEISGQGIETDAEALVRFRVLGEQLSPRPVILAPEWVATLGAHQDLAEAAWQATDDMVKLLSRQSRREEQEARLLVNLLGRLRVNQIVDPKKGARMEMPAWIFGT